MEIDTGNGGTPRREGGQSPGEVDTVQQDRKGRERCDRSHDRVATQYLAFHSVGESACQTSYIGFLMERWNVERKFSLSAD